MTKTEIEKLHSDSATMCDIEDAFRTSWRLGDYRTALHWVAAFLTVRAS